MGQTWRMKEGQIEIDMDKYIDSKLSPMMPVPHPQTEPVTEREVTA